MKKGDFSISVSRWMKIKNELAQEIKERTFNGGEREDMGDTSHVATIEEMEWILDKLEARFRGKA